eukprot:Skav217969  [mRNA]  locus=scaffold3450:303912:313927:+ [translate_table: standard]
MALSKTGCSFSHQGHPGRVKTITTCSSPFWIASAISVQSACCQPSCAGPLPGLGSDTRTNFPLGNKRSSPLFNLISGTTSFAVSSGITTGMASAAISSNAPPKYFTCLG